MSLSPALKADSSDDDARGCSRCRARRHCDREDALKRTRTTQLGRRRPPTSKRQRTDDAPVDLTRDSSDDDAAQPVRRTRTGRRRRARSGPGFRRRATKRRRRAAEAGPRAAVAVFAPRAASACRPRHETAGLAAPRRPAGRGPDPKERGRYPRRSSSSSCVGRKSPSCATRGAGATKRSAGGSSKPRAGGLSAKLARPSSCVIAASRPRVRGAALSTGGSASRVIPDTRLATTAAAGTSAGAGSRSWRGTASLRASLSIKVSGDMRARTWTHGYGGPLVRQ